MAEVVHCIKDRSKDDNVFEEVLKDFDNRVALLEEQARLKVDMTEISPYMLQTIIESNVELQ